MLSVSRPLCVRSLILCLAASLTAIVAGPAAHAQATSGTTGLERQLQRLDLGLNVTGSITTDVSGTNYLGQQVDHNTSTTVGGLAQFRYTKSAWKGAEFNIGYARYSHNFTTTAEPTTPSSSVPFLPVQTNSFEFTLGYVAHPHYQFLGAQPFFGGGGGLLYFHPTAGGGEGLPNQGAGAVYYNAGIEKMVLTHFGFRAQFRQLFYLAPDFYQNYLTVNKHASTFEPAIGFYIHY
jgi:hypothetical protein